MKSIKNLIKKIILSYKKHHHYIIDKGKNNSVEIVALDGTVKKIKKLKGSKIFLYGNNNHIKLYEPLGKLKLSINISHNVNITMQGSTERRYLHIETQKPADYKTINNVYIGKNFATTSLLTIELCNGNGDVTIGDDCLMSWGIIMRVGDWHTILDAETKKVLNPNKDIVLGNKVWCGSDVYIAKGVTIPDNCVVGARSVVTKQFSEPNCVIVGTPAKVVKTGIIWTKDSPYYSEMCEKQSVLK